MGKKELLFGFGILVVGILILTLTNIVAVGEVSYCCEKTDSGAWCQTSPPAICDTGYNCGTDSLGNAIKCKTSQTSCEATSYCRLGTCIDSTEGTCEPNTAQRVCNDNNGFWVEGDPEDIPQCQRGCCLIGDQASFVTQSRCERLSSIYGLETNFRLDIKSEISCIASATPYVMGACVFDQGFEKKCEMTTKEKCLGKSSEGTNIQFHKGYLCSAESLATICGPSKETTCVEYKEDVYFLDTCGNIANIYDASKVDNKEYWTYIKEESESCVLNLDSNAATCGNCEYSSEQGSTCKAYQRGNSKITQPRHGNFVCADLSCEYKGETYKHGETWCVTSASSRVGENVPGSEYYRLVCYDGDVTIEPCAARRAEVCIQSESNEGYRTAACRVNRWEDCVLQDTKKDCANTDKRDCEWLEGESILTDDEGHPLVVNNDDELVEGGNREGATCVPLYAPGFEFWDPESGAKDACSIVSEDCFVEFEKGLLQGSWDAVGRNKECKQAIWEEEKSNLCVAVGDCGDSVNYIGRQGYHNTSVVEIK